MNDGGMMIDESMMQQTPSGIASVNVMVDIVPEPRPYLYDAPVKKEPWDTQQSTMFAAQGGKARKMPKSGFPYKPLNFHDLTEHCKNPKRLSLDGVYPTFSADGKTIYFERQRKKVMAIDLYGGNERELFPAKNKKFKRYQVVIPRVSSDGRWVAFTSDRKGRWNAWYAEIKTGQAFRIHKGCEPVFFSDSNRLAWVKNVRGVAKERSGIYTYNISNRSFETLEDAGPPRGHEYMPTLAANDRYLLYSVCRPKEHSHETGNYQIFVKDLKTQTKTRITFDAYTNRWPKLLSHKENPD